MNKLFLLLFSLVVAGVFSSCDPVTVKPDVNILPPPEPTENFIDQYYYVQFTWNEGRGFDTVTMQEPLDTALIDTSRFYQVSFEMLSLPKKDTIGVDVDTDVEDLDTVGWVYAPTAAMYPSRYQDYLKGISGFPLEYSYRNIFYVSFPNIQQGDTVPFWDKQDYLDNPSVRLGIVDWGRIGQEMKNDSIFMFFQDQRDGVVISYVDQKGELWQTDNPPTFQPAGYFQIDSLIPNFRDGLSYNIMVGRFAARLYNNVGYYKDIKEGKFRMKIFTDIELGPKPE